jgi:UDPglucose 6-dehydrogenase
MDNNIGIIGQGFVGTAVRVGFEGVFEVHTYDINKNSTCSSLTELCERSKIIFVCVPTPMNKDGSCNTEIVENVLEDLNRLSKGHIAVLKSTVPPGTTERLGSKYKNLSLVFNPEFLTEANFIQDFKNQDRIIVGGPRPATTIIKNLYRKRFPSTPILKTGSNTAEMVKYFCNCFLATKVSFANEMRQICEQKNIDYDKVVEYSLYDKRIGKTHLSTPGPDGRYGFGGSCFPKDVNAIIKVMLECNINPAIMTAVWEKNLEVRPDRDWEKLIGRAVSIEEPMKFVKDQQADER